MVHAILLFCAMLADGGKPADPSPTDRAAYETAAAKAGKNAATHIKLALWCETHGLSSERNKHLTIASTLDPSTVLPRALLGLMAFQGKWAKPDQVEKEIHADPKFDALYREYLERRVHTPQKTSTPSCASPPGALRTDSRTRPWPTTMWSPASTRRETLPG